MFSLKATELKRSWVGIGLGGIIALIYVALLQLYWMPAWWRALLFLCIGFVGVGLLLRSIRQPKRKIGIDEQGAFLLAREHYIRLVFIRVNAVQLIAKEATSTSFYDRFWPTHYVVYRDSLNEHSYRTLRSFAAQQMLLGRSEEARKRTIRRAD
ncbi:hypothetical protein [Marinomonas profundimaris]|uniref:Uncharacterized protein n=1 Tax=Marinomonas profundimaris TaxID=1208321 RepID=W1RNY9_9GAMM|nr:hypothetical protein [Marinomonas profundimaris]ETI58446.1 hypothetical protein D104_14895 [Marinomonas profundimaris]